MLANKRGSFLIEEFTLDMDSKIVSYHVPEQPDISESDFMIDFHQVSIRYPCMISYARHEMLQPKKIMLMRPTNPLRHKSEKS